MMPRCCRITCKRTIEVQGEDRILAVTRTVASIEFVGRIRPHCRAQGAVSSFGRRINSCHALARRGALTVTRLLQEREPLLAAGCIEVDS